MSADGGRPLPADARDIRVDVVVDNFNYGRFLGDAIDSALAQTHPHVRVIAVDDGSTDESRSLLARYADRVELVLKENGGQASALNAGLARCRGDVVIFLDADDVLFPHAAAAVAEAVARVPGTVQVPYRLQVIDADGRRHAQLKPPAEMDLPAGHIAAAKLAFPFDVVSVGTSGNAFLVDALRRLGAIPEEDFAACADWFFVHLVPLLGRVTPVDEICGGYRVHGENAYEPQEPRLDLEHVRATVRYAAATTQELQRAAAELGMVPPFEEILSVSDLANRLISLRLGPELHPRRDDTVPRLLRDAVRASRRRWDSPPAMKLVFTLWFAVAAVAPRRALARLALVFLFRERRGPAGRLLLRLGNRRLRLDVRPQPRA
ncbi:MAG TPA: glycosyltransferase [Gaiellaceae bacterium]|nr:glycosyltransferase [Gaiellaceae bacterium]